MLSVGGIRLRGNMAAEAESTDNPITRLAKVIAASPDRSKGEWYGGRPQAELNSNAEVQRRRESGPIGLTAKRHEEVKPPNRWNPRS